MAAPDEEEKMQEEIKDNCDETKEEQDMEEDDDDSSSDDEDENPRIKELRDSLSEKPYMYDNHLELIKLLRDAGELDQCREARENMNKSFPLASDLWLAWVKDEQKFMDTESASERENIRKLFERATRDYLSVEVWLEYCLFSMGGLSGGGEGDNASPEDQTRDVFERALTAAGLHVSKGALLWTAYREYEMAVLAGLQPLPGSTASEEQQKAIDVETKRISKLFHRQLSVPHRDMENTFEEYQEWCEEVDPNTEKAYKTAVGKLELLEPFENKLETCTAEEQSAVYVEYLDEEMTKHKDPARIQCLFERAITDKCLESQIWTKYLLYLEHDLHAMSSDIFSVYERGVRNVPWCTELWLGYVRAAERHQRSHHTVKAIFDRALAAGLYGANDVLQVWTALLDYLRRGIEWGEQDYEKDLEEFRTTFERAIHVLQTAYPNEQGLVVPLLKYAAWIEAKFCKNMEKARELLNESTKQMGSNEAQTWLHFIMMERAFGDRKHARKLFQRALNSVTDWLEGVVDAFINFEREEGTLDQYDQAVERCENQMKRINKRRAEQGEKEAKSQGSGTRQGGDQQKKKFEKGKGKRTFQDGPAFQKGHQKGHQKGQRGQKGQQVQGNPPSQQNVPVFKRGAQAAQAAASPKKDADGFAVPAPVLPSPDSKTTAPESKPKSQPPPGFKPKSKPPPGFKPKSQPPPGFKEESDEPPTKKMKVEESSEQEESMEAEAGTADKDYTSTQDRTAFLSNLDYNADEEAIQKLFSGVGPITDIRLIKNPGGRSKGYAYVEFTDELAVAEAIKLDRSSVNGRPVFVSKCEDKKNKPAAAAAAASFKYATELEKNKVFVRGLPFSATEADVRGLFGQHGELRSVRIVTFRNGKSKGLAYVEYEKEVSASQAVMKLDNMEMDGHTISVAISCPPQRKVQQPTTEFTPTLGGGKKEGVDRGGRSRTMLAFQPRSVSTKTATNPVKKAAARGESTQKKPDVGNGNQEKGKMSNEDFRNMLLKK